MTRYWQYRLVGMVAALPLLLFTAGHAQESDLAAVHRSSVQAVLLCGRVLPTDVKHSPHPLQSQPVVTYLNGKLTVTAWNASLADVLRAISAQTGTVIDFPTGSAADRIFLREGPGTFGRCWRIC